MTALQNFSRDCWPIQGYQHHWFPSHENGILNSLGVGSYCIASIATNMLKSTKCRNQPVTYEKSVFRPHNPNPPKNIKIKNTWKGLSGENEHLTDLILTFCFLAQYHFQQYWPRKTSIASRASPLDYSSQLFWRASWWVAYLPSSNWQFLATPCLVSQGVSIYEQEMLYFQFNVDNHRSS